MSANGVVANPEALRDFANRLEQTMGHARSELAALRAMLSAMVDLWRGEAYETYVREFEVAAGMLEVDLAEFERQATRVRNLAKALDDIQYGRLEARSYTAADAAGNATRKAPSANKPGQASNSPSRWGQARWSPGRANANHDCWARDGTPMIRLAVPRYRDATTRTPPFRQLTPYLELARHLDAVITHFRSGKRSSDFVPGTAEARCCDAFFGSDPIRLEIGPDGAMNVIDGSHRLAACAQLGIDPPVVIVDRGHRESS
jgi:uncharacterized protein YukE